jgi:hypothetical protein
VHRVTPQPSADRPPDLMLVPAGSECTSSESFERRRLDGPPPLARPSDQLEPWLLETGSPLAAFADVSTRPAFPDRR